MTIGNRLSTNISFDSEGNILVKWPEGSAIPELDTIKSGIVVLRPEQLEEAKRHGWIEYEPCGKASWSHQLLLATDDLILVTR